MMRPIYLTQRRVTLVDDADYDWLSQWRWFAHRDHRTFYARRGIWRNGTTTIVKMHRLILDAPPGSETDHINGNGLDNRRCNLRLCSTAENQYNSRKRLGTSSRYKGVSRHRKQWRAMIKVQGRSIHLGCFGDEEAAACAYDEAARQSFGRFACINFPNDHEEASHAVSTR